MNEGKRFDVLPGRLLERVYLKIVDSYHPRYLDTRGVLFRAEPIDGNVVVRGFDDSQGWQNLFSHGLALEMNEVLKRHWSEHDNQAGAIASVDSPDR